MKVIRTNVYLEGLQYIFQPFVDSFIKLRAETIAKMENDKKEYKEPYERMRATYDKAYKDTLKLKQNGIQAARTSLQGAITVEREKRNASTDLIKELQKLNTFFDFQNVLTAMEVGTIEDYIDEHYLTDVQTNQIKAELATRMRTEQSEERRYQIEKVVMKVKLYAMTPLQQIEKANAELDRIEKDINFFPYLPTHIVLQADTIPQLLGQQILNDEYYSKHSDAPKDDNTAIIHNPPDLDALTRSVINAKMG